MNISLEGFWGMEERWKDDSGAFRPGRWDARLHPRLVDILRGRGQVSRIVYISCNAESMAEDVAKLGTSTEEEADDFIPTRAVAVDSFPQTVHVEVIALVERASRVRDRQQRTLPEAEPVAVEE
eukprot:symbB.v1.2.036168.t1/scaffold5043.1/size31561/4